MQLSIVFELAPIDTLMDRANVLSEEEARTVMIQLLLTADLLALRGIIHHDVKHDNILVLNSKTLEIQLTDFGMACKDDDLAGIRLKCGSPGYIAPEILKEHEVTCIVDIFSLGCVLYYLLTQKNLMNAPTLRKMVLMN